MTAQFHNRAYVVGHMDTSPARKFSLAPYPLPARPASLGGGGGGGGGVLPLSPPPPPLLFRATIKNPAKVKVPNHVTLLAGYRTATHFITNMFC